MAETQTLVTLPYALGIELPGGQMRPFLEIGCNFPSPEERVRLVSRLRERTRLQLRVVARVTDGPIIGLGTVRLSGIKLNPQGEATLLVSMQSLNGEYVELQITDELGKSSAEASFRLPLNLDAFAVSGEAAAAHENEAALRSLMQRVADLESELGMKYNPNGQSGRTNGIHAEPGIESLEPPEGPSPV
ncbi:MAG: hypothetical protein ABI743_05735 [bacterium]